MEIMKVLYQDKENSVYREKTYLLIFETPELLPRNLFITRCVSGKGFGIIVGYKHHCLVVIPQWRWRFWATCRTSGEAPVLLLFHNTMAILINCSFLMSMEAVSSMNSRKVIEVVAVRRDNFCGCSSGALAPLQLLLLWSLLGFRWTEVGPLGVWTSSCGQLLLLRCHSMDDSISRMHFLNHVRRWRLLDSCMCLLNHLSCLQKSEIAFHSILKFKKYN